MVSAGSADERVIGAAMTTTVPGGRAPALPVTGGGGVGGGGGSRLPAPPRDRRPALAALALLLIVAGALASALVAYRSGNRVDVLVARRELLPGQLVQDADLGVARVAADSGAVVPAGSRSRFVGTTAIGLVPSGTLLNATMFLAGGVIPSGAVVVGVVLSAEQRPAEPLQQGDVVRAYLVAKTDNSSAVTGRSGDVLLAAARVVEVRGGTGSSGGLDVSLLVSQQQAGAVITAAASDQVALARLAPDTKPPVDLRTS
jgi:hypothetical protein